MIKFNLQFFGGRGASSAGGGGGGSANGELKLPDGTEVEFEGELHYQLILSISKYHQPCQIYRIYLVSFRRQHLQ